MGDSEALLFVDNEQAEVFEADIFTEQAVCADEDIDFAFSCSFYYVARFFGGSETIQDFNRDGKICKSFGESPAVLDAKYRCGDKYGDLSAVFDGFEGGAHRKFGFAVADVTAKQSVHSDSLLHVRFDLFGCGGLVGGFLVGK